MNQKSSKTLMRMRSFNYFILVITSLFLSCCQTDVIDLRVSDLFSTGMVLQQNDTVTVWGTAAPETKISINASWGAKASMRTADNGRWQIDLKTPDAGGPYELKISTAGETISIEDVLIGEVWLAAGQSNMEMDFDYTRNSTDQAAVQITTANFPEIRMFTIKKKLSQNPSQEVEGMWQKAVGKDITHFSAAAYFFAKKLHEELGVPVGILHSSWGGTSIQSWMSRETLSDLDFLDKSLEYYDSLALDAAPSEAWFSQFKSIPLPSIGWEFFLSAYIEQYDAEIDHADFFIDQWRSIIFQDETVLTAEIEDQASGWDKITIPYSIKDAFGTDDFSGVTLLRRTFDLDKNESDLILTVNSGEDLGWDLFEIDCYINGKRFGSTFGETGEDIIKSYRSFPARYLPSIQIPRTMLLEGQNTIALRVIGTGAINNIALRHIDGTELSLNGEWYVRIWAEVYSQMRDYVFPYTSFYLYESQGIDFSKRPSPVSYDRSAYSSIFNAMVYPLVPFKLRGVIWYQGENNAFEADNYRELFPRLVSSWRSLWGSDFPFYYAQIAPYFGYQGQSGTFRNTQRNCLALIPQSGMIVTLDIAENYDIHPSNKHDVGYRFAQLALANDYGKDIVPSGPLYDEVSISNNKITVDFINTGAGLVLIENGKTEFEVAGVDTVFVPAQARISNNQVEVFSTQVRHPRFVRYAWSDTSRATLFNSEGFPASTFSSLN